MYSQEGSVFIGRWVKNWKNKFLLQMLYGSEHISYQNQSIFLFSKRPNEKRANLEIVGSFLKIIKIKEKGLNSVNVTLG